MKCTALILTAALVSAFASAVYCAVWYPNHRIKALERDYLRPTYDIMGKGSMFTEYDTELAQGTTVENDYFSMMLPEGFAPKSQDTGVESYAMQTEDSTGIIVTNGNPAKTPSLQQIDLNQYYEFTLPQPANLEHGYMELCGMYPESSYEQDKCAVLLDVAEFDYMDYDRAYAFCQLATLRGLQCWGVVDAYVYEHNDISGVLYVKDVEFKKAQKDGFMSNFVFYSNDDHNTPYAVEIVSDSMDIICGVINSITMK